METHIYEWLKGNAADPSGFSAHVFACVVSDRCGERTGPLTDLLGLDDEQFYGLLEDHFPGAVEDWDRKHCFRKHACERTGLTFAAGAANPGPHPIPEPPEDPFDEEGDLIDLMMTHHSWKPSEARWLATLVARACMRPNHLWEDLGLGNRAELSKLIERYFNPLFMKNTENMRWKKFFYKQLCEGEGLYICKAPVCTECSDYDLCFPGEE